MARKKKWVELNEWESYEILGVHILAAQYIVYKCFICKLMDMDNCTFYVWIDPCIIEVILHNIKVKETNDCIWVFRWGIHEAIVETIPDENECGFDPVIMERV